MMKKITFLISLTVLVCHFNANANRSLYVNGFASILGNSKAENNLLSYAKANQIKTLLLYEFYLLDSKYNLSNSESNFVLANFIFKAKTNYGITKVGVVAENSFLFINSITPYNNSRKNPKEKIDIYNLEFEFWRSNNVNPGKTFCKQYLTPNGFECSKDGGFQFFISILKKMRNSAKKSTHPISIEAYVGWITEKQANVIGNYIDKLLLHAYVPNPYRAFGYSKTRLRNLANGTPGLNVSIIFESEPKYMQNWLENNSMLTAENIFLLAWMNESKKWKYNIDLSGFTYFKYSSNTTITLLPK